MLNAEQQRWVDDFNKEIPMLWADHGGGDFEQPPVGTHVARCVKIIDIGTHRGEYQGKVTIRRQCIVGWELPNELMSEGEYAGKPFAVSRFYTASLSEKANLRKDLENWRGRAFTEAELAGFDAKNILSKACMLSLTENDKGKVKVTGVMALPRGTQVPDQINPLVFLSLERNEFDAKLFQGMSDGYKKLIMASPEYQEITRPGSTAPAGKFADMDDDIPF